MRICLVTYYEVCPYHSKVQSDPNLAKLTFNGDVLVNLNSRKIHAREQFLAFQGIMLHFCNILKIGVNLYSTYIPNCIINHSACRPFGSPN